MDAPSPPDTPAPRWWRERELWLLVLLCAGVYFTRVTELPLRGEETRRATVAVEMLETGDWVVPRQQGTIYLSRPPGGSWPMLAVGLLRGGIDDFAVRLPSAVAVLLTGVLLYGYGRVFLSRPAAFAGAVAFAAAAQVMRMGRLAENEAVFTLCVAASLLLWHRGYATGKPAWRVWLVGYALAGCAGLVKGPQGPVYFCAAAGAWCAVRRDWRFLLGRGHLVGMLGFAATAGLWHALYLSRAGWDHSVAIWTGQAANRFVEHTWGDVLAHAATYPLGVLVATLPFSGLLPALLIPSVRRELGAARPAVRFAAVALAVTFPTVWFAPGAEVRYAMPLFPLLALLAGAAVECGLNAGAKTWAVRGWRNFLAAATFGVVVGGAAVAVLAVTNRVFHWTAVFAPLFAVAGIVAGCCLWRARTDRTPGVAVAAVAALGAFCGLTYSGAIVNARAAVGNDLHAAVAEARAQLPDGAEAVSLGFMTHEIRYHHPGPLRQVPFDAARANPAVLPEYFWVDDEPLAEDEAARGPLPFAWEPVAEVPLGRNRHDPHRFVILGRRVGGVKSAQSRGVATPRL